MAEEITFKGVQFSCPMGAVLNEGGDRCGKGIKKGSKVNFIMEYPLACTSYTVRMKGMLSSTVLSIPLCARLCLFSSAHREDLLVQ